MVRDTAFMYNCHSLQGQRYCIHVQVSCSTRSEMYKCHVLQGQRCCSHVQLSCSTRWERLQSCTTVTFCFISTAETKWKWKCQEMSHTPCLPAPFLISTVTQTPLQRQISMKIYQEMHSNFDLQNPQEIRRELMPLKKGLNKTSAMCSALWVGAG